MQAKSLCAPACRSRHGGWSWLALGVGVLTSIGSCAERPIRQEGGTGGTAEARNLARVGTSGGPSGRDCGPCLEVACRAEVDACGLDAACDAILQCSDTCAANNMGRCIGDCSSFTLHGQSNQSFEKLASCVARKCAANCGGQVGD